MVSFSLSQFQVKGFSVVILVCLRLGVYTHVCVKLVKYAFKNL